METAAVSWERPVLYLRSAEPAWWRLAATLARPAREPPPALSVSAGSATAPAALTTRLGVTLWRYELALPRGAAPASITYAVRGARHAVMVPGRDEALRVAFTSCNGSEAIEHPLMQGPERTRRWRELLAVHAREPFHVLLQGGDQVYADAVWGAHPALARYWPHHEGDGLLRRREPAQAPRWSEAAARAVGDFYFRLMLEQWARPGCAEVLAQVPSVMMWDDHDIIDGWGSHTRWHQHGEVFQGIWRAAREAYAWFQVGAAPDALPGAWWDRRGGHFGVSLRLNRRVGLIVPDLRSERTGDQVLGSAGWRDLERALADLGDCEEVVLVSSVPLVYVDLRALEALFDVMPGLQDYQDDLRDQWGSLAHAAEWVRLLDRLLAITGAGGPRFTVLSGEVHVGARGEAWRGGARLHQLISSGIAHPPPPRALVRLLEGLGRLRRRPGAGISACMRPLSGWGRRVLDRRNWLALELPVGGGARAVWHAGRPVARWEIGPRTAQAGGDVSG